MPIESADLNYSRTTVPAKDTDELSVQCVEVHRVPLNFGFHSLKPAEGTLADSVLALPISGIAYVMPLL